MKTVTVTAGLIAHNGRFLIAQRRKDKSLGGFWEFPGGKIESEGIGIVIVRGESRSDILAHLADSQDQFGLVMQFLAEVGDVERPVPDQQRCVWLAEEHRLFRHLGSQFLDMFPVILSYADDFHRFLCLKKCYVCY